MNPYLIIVLIGCSYVVIFGALSLLRREGLSLQFALEVSAVTALVLVLLILTNATLNPVLFLVIIYLVSMRVRLLADLANLLVSRGQHNAADSVLRIALMLGPDKAGRLIVQINQGTVWLRQGDPTKAKEIFLQVLEAGKDNGLSDKYEAACRYHLAVAYRRLDNEAGAVAEFNKVLELMPSSVYAQAAEKGLAQRRQAGKKMQEEEETTLDE